MENSRNTPEQINLQTEDTSTSDISDITSNSDISIPSEQNHVNGKEKC